MQTKFFLFFITICILSFPLHSETYSNYRMDDVLYFSSGIRDFTYGTRIDSQGLSNTTGYYLHSYWNTNYLTQGGVNEFYLIEGSVSPEIGLFYDITGFQLYIIASYTGKISKKRENETLQSFQNEWEGILGGSWGPLFFQGGRGFYRGDKIGFLLANPINFFELGLGISQGYFSYFELRLLLGNTQPIQNKQDIYSYLTGIWFRGYLNFLKLNWNIFYLKRELPKSLPNYIEKFQPGIVNHYYGLELGIFFLSKLLLNLGGLGYVQKIDNHIPFFFQESTKDSRHNQLYYFQGEYFYLNFNIGISKIFFTNGVWEGLESKNRFMGGQGSILLDFPDLDARAKKDGYGINLGWRYSWIKEWMAVVQIHLNSFQASYGNGKEGILSLGINNNLRGFFYLSFAYAYIDPQQKKALFVEEFQVPISDVEAKKIFISSGIYF